MLRVALNLLLLATASDRPSATQEALRVLAQEKATLEQMQAEYEFLPGGHSLMYADSEARWLAGRRRGPYTLFARARRDRAEPEWVKIIVNTTTKFLDQSGQETSRDKAVARREDLASVQIVPLRGLDRRLIGRWTAAPSARTPGWAVQWEFWPDLRHTAIVTSEEGQRRSDSYIETYSDGIWIGDRDRNIGTYYKLRWESPTAFDVLDRAGGLVWRMRRATN